MKIFVLHLHINIEKMFYLKGFKVSIKWLFVACLMGIFGFLLCKFFAAFVYYFWWHQVATLPKKEQNGIYGGSILFFFGLALVLFSFFFFEKSISRDKEKITKVAIDWEHFKPREIHYSANKNEDISTSSMGQKAEEKEKPPEQKPKYQAVQRGTKAIQTTQLRPQLSENQQQDIRNLINQSL